MTVTIEKIEKQFEEEVAQHKNEIFSYIYRKINNNELAKDIFQETLIRAFKCTSQKNFTFDQFRALLYKIAGGAVVDETRKKFFKIKQNAVSLHDPHIQISVKNDIDVIEEKQVRRDLGLAINKLPEKLRLAVIRCYFQNMSYNEAAKAEKVRETQIRSRLHRAKNILRTKAYLKEYLVA